MSGHSKWHSIRQKKGAADAKRGQIFSKLSKAITVCAKEGGGDPAMNFSLRLAIEKAKAANMPKENIDRAIARGTGEGMEGVQIQTVMYELMGPGGSALLVEAVTDNSNRTLTNVKTICNKQGVTVGASVKWMFERKGVVRVDEVQGANTEELELALIDAGAEDIAWDPDAKTGEFVCAVADLQTLKEAAEAADLHVDSASLEYIAKEKLVLSSEDEEKLTTVLELLDEDDDVTNIYTNAA